MSAQAATVVVDDFEILVERVQPIERIRCGHTHPDPVTERRYQELRKAQGHKIEGGCNGNMLWTYAYRCVECGRFFHRECILAHFAEHRS